MGNPNQKGIVAGQIYDSATPWVSSCHISVSCVFKPITPILNINFLQIHLDSGMYKSIFWNDNTMLYNWSLLTDSSLLLYTHRECERTFHLQTSWPHVQWIMVWVLTLWMERWICALKIQLARIWFVFTLRMEKYLSLCESDPVGDSCTINDIIDGAMGNHCRPPPPASTSTM